MSSKSVRSGLRVQVIEDEVETRRASSQTHRQVWNALVAEEQLLADWQIGLAYCAFDRQGLVGLERLSIGDCKNR